MVVNQCWFYCSACCMRTLTVKITVHTSHHLCLVLSYKKKRILDRDFSISALLLLFNFVAHDRTDRNWKKLKKEWWNVNVYYVRFKNDGVREIWGIWMRIIKLVLFKSVPSAKNKFTMSYQCYFSANLYFFLFLLPFLF